MPRRRQQSNEGEPPRSSLVSRLPPGVQDGGREGAISTLHAEVQTFMTAPLVRRLLQVKTKLTSHAAAIGPSPRVAGGRTQRTRGAAARRVRRPRQRNTDGGGVREEEDRFSSLPLDLQLEVLARLKSAREAARTSMVSRPWRGLWTQLRELTFDGIADPDKLAGALRLLGELTQAGPRLNRLCIHLPGNLKLGDARISSLLHAADRLAPLDLELVEHVEDCAADERAAPEEAGPRRSQRLGKPNPKYFSDEWVHQV